MAFGSPQWMYKSGEAFTIDQSLRFNDDDSPYLNRTFGSSPTSLKTWTLSCWIKRGNLGTTNYVLSYDSGGNPMGIVGFNSSDQFHYYDRDASSGSADIALYTTQLFRDPSAWYHFVIKVDTTQGTASNRVKIYLNGLQITAWATETYPAEDYDTILVGNHYVNISGWGSSPSSSYIDGYLSELHFIDGTAVAASSFGEAGDYGEWKPIEVSGLTYGTNGFYLDFADSGALGDDESGNTNDWTANNLAATDQVVDSPTNNFATLNPLDKSGTVTLSEGNLKYVNNTGVVRGSMAGGASDKFYLEYCQVTAINGSNPIILGIGTTDGSPSHESNHIQSMMVHCDGDAQKNARVFIDNAQVQTSGFTALQAITTGGILQFAYDGTTGKAWVGINGSWVQGDPAAGSSPIYTFSDTSKPMTAFIDHAGVTHTGVINFGQDSSFAGNKTAQGNQDGNSIGDFYYTPPSGFLALCTKNMSTPDVTPSEHFNTVLYTGNDTGRTISGVGFQPDFNIIRNREIVTNTLAFDALRDSGNESLRTDSNIAGNSASDEQTGYASDGFVLGTGEDVNGNAEGIVSWCWKANGSGSSNTDGTINTTSTSANVDAGFSIVSYRGNATAYATIGHGLSKAPEMIIIKNRDDTEYWLVYHQGVGTTGTTVNSLPEYYMLYLNDGGARQDFSVDTIWGSTATTFMIDQTGNSQITNNSSEDYIAYCWHSVDGYSKVGSYTGNGNADGTFVYTGFRPAFVLNKNLDNADSWQLFDNKRSPYNVMDERLIPNLTNAEQTNTDAYDFTSNGFKIRTSDANFNTSGETYIYIAFAETPFKYSNAR